MNTPNAPNRSLHSQPDRFNHHEIPFNHHANTMKKTHNFSGGKSEGFPVGTPKKMFPSRPGARRLWPVRPWPARFADCQRRGESGWSDSDLMEDHEKIMVIYRDY